MARGAQPLAHDAAVRFRPAALLKEDLFGRVERGHSIDGQGRVVAAVFRDLRAARWWVRPLARHLARREARALRRLGGCPGVPRLLHCGREGLLRSWLEGQAMQEARPRDPAYFQQALRLVSRLHRLGVAHNDLAKEPNWLVTPEGAPALVDFQLSRVSRRRRGSFPLLAREDLRHMLKHKRRYCPGELTAREQRILAQPSAPARLWRVTGKRVYLWITRGLLGWADREGAGDRGGA